jgi:glycosyltransferase involved in cell wall biosynthesis
MADHPKIRVYGDFADCCSWGRVAAGMVLGLEANGALADACQIRAMADGDGGTLAIGAEAEVAVYVGPQTHMGVLKSVGKHRERLFFIAPNSSWLPAEMMGSACQVTTGIVASSSWGRSVVRDQGYGLACYLWHLGVDEVFAPSLEPATDPSVWAVLHMTSTLMQRKSTSQLIEGWGRAIKSGRFGPGVRLDIVVTPQKPVARLVLDHVKELGVPEMLDTVRVLHRKNMSTWRAARFYGGYNAVCQPSRAEGFGLVPLEARACGLPVIMTRATGHADHATGPGLVVVPHGSYDDIDDGPGAMAPTVDAKDVADALVDAYERRDELAAEARGHADQIRAEWSWPRVTKRWLDSMFYSG